MGLAEEDTHAVLKPLHIGVEAGPVPDDAEQQSTYKYQVGFTQVF